MELLIVYDNIKSFFAEIYEVCKFERVYAEIRCQFSFHSYVIGINAKLVYQKLLQIFKHIISSFAYISTLHNNTHIILYIFAIVKCFFEKK